MLSGTSPSIAAASGGYEIAIQRTDGKLIAVGAAGNTTYSQHLLDGTGPSITG